MTQGEGCENRERVVEFVGDMARELASLAKAADYGFLSYLLHMTATEAAKIAAGRTLGPLDGAPDSGGSHLH
jgi:hypothetical protein